MNSEKKTLFVSGFHKKTRAKNLAYEFERFGKLIRLDIPAPKNAMSKPYAFVEFEESSDAKEAYEELNGRIVNGDRLDIEWAKTDLIHDNRRFPIRSRRRSTSPPIRKGRSASPERRRYR